MGTGRETGRRRTEWNARSWQKGKNNFGKLFSVLLNENSAREIFRSEMMQQKKGFEEMMRRRRWNEASETWLKWPIGVRSQLIAGLSTQRRTESIGRQEDSAFVQSTNAWLTVRE